MLSRCSTGASPSPTVASFPPRGPMRNADGSAAALLLAGAVAAAVRLAAQEGAAAELVNRIVLRVDDEIATLSDWKERTATSIEQIGSVEGMALEERRRLVADAGRAAM